jgi:hypothetical protein
LGAGVAGRKGWRRDLLAVAAQLGIAPLLALIPAVVVYSVWSEAAATKAEWTVRGPACRIVDRPSRTAVSPRKPPITFRYHGVVFTRSFAAASCAPVAETPLWPRETYPVCQFNNPGAITVVAEGRRVVFEPPAGRHATVTVRHGEIRCVVGGTFNF